MQCLRGGWKTIIWPRESQFFSATTPVTTVLFTAAAQLKRLLNKYSSECGVGYRQRGLKLRRSEVEKEQRQNQRTCPASAVADQKGCIVEVTLRKVFLYQHSFSFSISPAERDLWILKYNSLWLNA